MLYYCKVLGPFVSYEENKVLRVQCLILKLEMPLFGTCRSVNTEKYFSPESNFNATSLSSEPATTTIHFSASKSTVRGTKSFPGNWNSAVVSNLSEAIFPSRSFPDSKTEMRKVWNSVQKTSYEILTKFLRNPYILLTFFLEKSNKVITNL